MNHSASSIKEALCERIRSRTYDMDYGESISNISKIRKIQRHLIDVVIMIESMVQDDNAAGGYDDH